MSLQGGTGHADNLTVPTELHFPPPPSSDPARFGAPIDYQDVGRSYNTVRAACAALITIIGTVGWVQGSAYSEYVVAAGLVVAFHALFERSRQHTALAPLLVDASLIGTVGIIQGYSGALIGAGFVYLLTGSLLLLPLRRAVGVVGYGALWALLLRAVEPLRAHEDSVVVEVTAILVSGAVVAQLLYATGQALFAAEGRHREALSAERRAVELKDEFVSMVSHELRTPLTSIGGFADTLRESWSRLPPNEVDEFLLIMRGEAQHLANLVEDILVIPRLEAGQLRLEPQSIPLRTEAYEVSRLVFAGTRREVQVDIPVDVVVVADPHRLRQIFRNLLENARKYGGDQVLIAGERTGPSYKVVIADNGPGIPVEDRTRIFEHFEQAVKGDARSEGVGLGLPIARKLARAMGGDLWFEPRFPTGAQFLFTVTTAEESDSSDRPAPPADNITPMRRTDT